MAFSKQKIAAMILQSWVDFVDGWKNNEGFFFIVCTLNLKHIHYY